MPNSYFITTASLLVILCRVADPHHFNADPDPVSHFIADPVPDPAFHFNADPDPDPALLESDGNLRPPVYRPSRAPF
jgi:hypothetical protein